MKKILIIEDDKSIRQALVDKFSIEGFEVHESDNGKKGCEMAAELKPDLIMLDILMPKMDGLTCMEQIRSTNEYGKNVPIIILTNVEIDNDVLQKVSKYKPSFYCSKNDTKIQDIVTKAKTVLGLN